MRWIILLSLVSMLHAQSGIAAIDTLSENEWDIATNNKSLKTGLLMAATLPGGAHYYTGHYVRAGFLTALELYLISEIFFTQPSLLQKRQDEAKESFTLLDKTIETIQTQADKARAINLFNTRDSLLTSVRRADDKIAEIDGLVRSQKAWLIGLHLYGFLDGYGILHNNLYGRSKQKRESWKAALWSIIPGGGQFYNQEWGKAGLLDMALDGAYVSFHARQQTVVHYRTRLQTARIEENFSETNYLEEKLTFFRKKRNQYIWAPILFYLYSVGDSMVDALLADFDSPVHLSLNPIPTGGALEIAWDF